MASKLTYGANVPKKEEYVGDASTVGKKVDNTWTDEQKTKAINNAAINMQGVQNNAISPENMNRLYAWWNNNFAKNNPRGNLNGQSFDNTLNASRQADALNNRQYWRAARIGKRTNSSFGSTGITAGQAYKYAPIETQETRQMRANENVDLLARKGQQQLATEMQQYPFEMQQAIDKNILELDKLATTTGFDIKKYMQQSVWDSEYGDSFDTYWANLKSKFGKELDEDLRQRVLNNLSSLEHPLKEMYAGLEGTTAPDVWTEWILNYINAFTADISDPKEQLTTLATVIGSVLQILAKQTGESLGDVSSGLLEGLNSSGGMGSFMSLMIPALLFKIFM